MDNATMNLYVRSYCCRENLFTCGSNYQYQKMFEMSDLHDKAFAIWLCSDTKKSIDDIYKDLLNIKECC